MVAFRHKTLLPDLVASGKSQFLCNPQPKQARSPSDPIYSSNRLRH
jgi:hypothetical protein